VNQSSIISKPWIRRSATGFAAIGIGGAALLLLSIKPLVHGINAQSLGLMQIIAFIIATSGYFLVLQKFLYRRNVLHTTLAEIEWRDQLLNKAPFGIITTHANGTLLLNNTAKEWLGVNKLEKLHDLCVLFSPNDESAFTQALNKFIDNDDAFTFDSRLRHSDMPVKLIGTADQVLWLQDRTDEKQSATIVLHEKAALQAELTKLNIIAHALPRPLWLRRLNGQIMWVNEAYAKSLDSTREACVAQSLEFSPRIGVNTAREQARKAVESGVMQTDERHVVVDGTRRLFRAYEIPIIAEGYVVGFAVDQTEVEELTTEMQRHTSAFEETLEQVGAPIAIFDAQQKLQFYNQAYQQLWQFNDAFLRTHPTYGDMLEDLRARRKLPEVVDFARYRRERLQLFNSLIKTQEEMWHLPDATIIRHLSIPHPLGGLMFVTEDVTDKLALESSYNTLIAVQQETLDNLAEGIAVIGSDGRLRLSNPAFARIWALEENILELKPHVTELLENMRPLLHNGQEDWTALRNGTVVRLLDRIPRAVEEISRMDGSVVEHISVPLPDGNVMHSYLDITARTRVEAALRATNKALAAADKLKSEFVANVSYQLRTPLSTIIGFAEILTNQYFGPLNERQADYTKTILEASRKLLALINTVLDLATIEAGRMILVRRPVDIKRLLVEAVAGIANWAERQNLTLSLNCPDGFILPEIDERRMQQVLLNLLTNAIQYTPPQGSISITAAQSITHTSITIADTGIGMTDSERERVFNKFERANAQARQPGVGLGLSLVKSLVDLHNGTIALSSAPNKGTSITLHIPNHFDHDDDKKGDGKKDAVA
jgi:signal transduction histidine kinase